MFCTVHILASLGTSWMLSAGVSETERVSFVIFTVKIMEGENGVWFVLYKNPSQIQQRFLSTFVYYNCFHIGKDLKLLLFNIIYRITNLRNFLYNINILGFGFFGFFLHLLKMFNLLGNFLMVLFFLPGERWKSCILTVFSRFLEKGWCCIQIQWPLQPITLFMRYKLLNIGIVISVVKIMT